MIIPLGSDGRLTTVDIRVAADAPWNDSFFITEITRPLAAEWASIELIIRPSYDHETLIRKLSSVGGSPEIIVDDADLGAFSFHVGQPIVGAFERGRFTQMLRVVYADDDADSFEVWRGAFIVEPGLLP